MNKQDSIQLAVPIQPGVGITAAPAMYAYNITFHKDGKQMGCLDYSGDQMKFIGDADEAAHTFFNNLGDLWKESLERGRKQGLEEATIKLVPFKEVRNFVDTYKRAIQCLENEQLNLELGEVWDMQPLMDLAVEEAKRGNLVFAACVMLAIAEHTRLLDKDGVPGGWFQTVNRR